MSDLTPEHIALGLTTYVVLLFSLSVHESAHAWMAWKLGDDTAKNLGRVSLNPIVHIDPIGTRALPALQIFTERARSWAGPSRRPTTPPTSGATSACARGTCWWRRRARSRTSSWPCSSRRVLFVLVRAGVDRQPRDFLLDAHRRSGIELNVLLAVFNLVPIPPLDGSKVASFGLPGDLGERYDRVMGPYGFVILMLLLMTGALGYVLAPDPAASILGLLFAAWCA